MLVNKAELRQILGCSAPTLDAWIAKHAEFPVVSRGGPGRNWQFDCEVVKAFLQAQDQAEIEADRERTNQIRQLALPMGHNGGPSFDEAAPTPLKPSEMLALAKLRKLQRDEEYECGRLVRVKEVHDALSAVFGDLGRAQRAWVSRCGSELGLSADQVCGLTAGLAQFQRDFVDVMQRRLKGSEQVELPFASTRISAAA